MRIQLIQYRVQYRMERRVVVIPGILPSCIQTEIPYRCPVAALFTIAHNAFDNFRCRKLCNIVCYNSYVFGLLTA